MSYRKVDSHKLQKKPTLMNCIKVHFNELNKSIMNCNLKFTPQWVNEFQQMIIDLQWVATKSTLTRNIITLNTQQTNIQMFHNVADIQPTINKIIFYPKKVCACECFDTCMFECAKIFFDVIKSLFIREGCAKVLLDKALIWGKDCKKK
jgi:hypothetical protein